MSKSSGKRNAAMRRFEEFAKRIFSISKEDLKKAEEAAEEVAEETTKPTERSTPDE
jgi:hypothetical protein